MIVLSECTDAELDARKAELVELRDRILSEIKTVEIAIDIRKRGSNE